MQINSKLEQPLYEPGCFLGLGECGSAFLETSCEWNYGVSTD